VRQLTLNDLAEKLKLQFHTYPREVKEVTGGYAGDLLSDVMANARDGQVWLTIQVHENIVAVALLTNVVGVIITGGRKPLPETLERAREEGVVILSSDLSTFTLGGEIYRLLEERNALVHG
jgi:predicted transcriptional regulator